MSAPALSREAATLPQEASNVPSLTISIPGAPDLALSPNRRYRAGGYHAGNRAAQEARRTAFLAGIESRGRTGWETTCGPVRVAVVIAWPNGQRRLDWDGAIGCVKPLLDGIVDAFIIADDRHIVGIDVSQIRAPRDDRAGSVTLTIIPMEAP
jgi:hypothetical protein